MSVAVCAWALWILLNPVASTPSDYVLWDYYDSAVDCKKEMRNLGAVGQNAHCMPAGMGKLQP